MPTDFVLDALEQALYACQPEQNASLTHHSDRGSQYVFIRYTERLAETINGLYKAEVIHRRAPRKTVASLELVILEGSPGSTISDSLKSVGYIPPAKAEDRYYL